MKLFAYGSNLSIDRLRERAPSATFAGRARLDGYRLRFHKRGRDGSGKANVQRTGRAGDHVWGAVFECSATDRAALDRIEGLGRGYDAEVADVRLDDGRTETVRLYAAEPAAIDDDLTPFAWYRAYVVTGAEERALPPDYIAAIRRHPVARDPDRDRAARNALVLAGAES